jgi:hypothetical protein
MSVVVVARLGGVALVIVLVFALAGIDTAFVIARMVVALVIMIEVVVVLVLMVDGFASAMTMNHSGSEGSASVLGLMSVRSSVARVGYRGSTVWTAGQLCP